MYLAAALSNLRNFEQNIDRQKKLAETLKNPEKLAKTEMRIEFLLACRKNNLTPRFIDDALRPVKHIFDNSARVTTRTAGFAKTLLNEAISKAFRSRAFLLRQRTRLFESIRCYLDNSRYRYMSSTCANIFDITIRENRPRLIKKFRSLEANSLIEHDGSKLMEFDADTIQKRVKNLSSTEVGDLGLSLLAKGPNFATTQSVSETVLLQVEKGVERFAYAKRWTDKMSRGHNRPSGTIVPIPEANPAVSRTEPSTAAAVPTPGIPPSTTETTSTTTTRASCSTRERTSARLQQAPTTTEAEQTQAGPGRPGQDASGGTDDGDDNRDRQPRGCTPNLSFRFPDIGKNFPEPSNLDVERGLQKLKDDLIRTYKNHKVGTKNISTEQRQLIKDLAVNDNIIIKQSDKCKGLVIMDRPDYMTKAKDLLNDTDSFEKLDKNPIPQIEAKTKRNLLITTRSKLPDNTVKELTPGHSRTPVFYGLPKDHKPNVPLRPVISAYGGPTEKTSCLLERILKQLLKFVPTHLWDTKHFLEKLSKQKEQHGIPGGSIFFSIDVVNLYGNIPVDEAVEAVRSKLREHGDSIDTFGLSSDDICGLLEQSLGDNVFSFNNVFYRQKLGLAMGNPCAPPVAILFLDRFETKAVEASPLKPSFLTRYIDDYAGIWTHGQQALDEFLDFLNRQHPKLKFTLEHSGGGHGVPFLDTLVTVETVDNVTKLETEIYIKPTNSGIILHSTSAHPTETKYNIIRNMFHRAYNNSSSKQKEDKSIDKIWKLLLENGYNEGILLRLLGEVQRSRRKRERCKNRGTVREKQNKGKGREALNQRKADTGDGFLTLPYVDEQLLRKVKYIVKRSKFRIRLAWKNENKLKKSLVKTALCKPRCPGGQRCHLCKSGFGGDCTQKNVVYEISCKTCQQQGRGSSYVGESMRPIRLRYNEHRRDALNQTANTPFGDHFLTVPHQNEVLTDPKFLILKILYKAQDHPDRKIAESLFIRKRTPPLNFQCSSWPIMRAA